VGGDAKLGLFHLLWHRLLILALAFNVRIGLYSYCSCIVDDAMHFLALIILRKRRHRLPDVTCTIEMSGNSISDAILSHAHRVISITIIIPTYSGCIPNPINV